MHKEELRKVGDVERKQPRILENVLGVLGVLAKNTPTYTRENIHT